MFYNTRLVFDCGLKKRLVWELGSISLAQLLALEKEVQFYNEHIVRLFQGLVPPSSYKDPEDADAFAENSFEFYKPAGLVGCHIPEYDEVVKDYEFRIQCLAESAGDAIAIRDNGLDRVVLVEEFRDVEISTLVDLLNLLSSPYDMFGAEFAMGYRMLPMTKHLFGSHSIDD